MGVWQDLRYWQDSPIKSYNPQTGKETEEPGTSTLKTTTMRIIFATMVAFIVLFFGFLWCYYTELKPRSKTCNTAISDSESFM